MTSRPHLRLGRHLWTGLVAVVLFVGFIAAILQPSDGDPLDGAFGSAVGFVDGESVIANIGFALLDIDGGNIEVEGFLIAFILMAVLLDAALSGAVLLATRDAESGGGD